MPYPNAHALRLNSPDKYNKFRRENDKFGSGIDAIWGITKDGTVELQAIRFDKEKFSEQEAKKWAKEHDYSGKFEPALKDAESSLSEVYKIAGKEFKYRDFILKEIDLNVGNIDEIKYLTEESKNFQFAGLKKQDDLAYGSCILVSEGTNANGAYFDRNELIKARSTPILKPVDIEHNQDFIVGVIYDSAVATQSGLILGAKNIEEIEYENDKKYILRDDSGKELNEPIDIRTNFVIWKYLFPQLAYEILQHQKGESNTKYFVSMEVFYNQFGYMFDNNPETTIKVNEENIDIYYELDSYVGGKLENGRSVQKTYYNYFFGGMGITERPANSRSYLLDLASQEVKNDMPKITVVDSNDKGTDRECTHTHMENAQVEEQMDKEKLELLEKAVNKLMAANSSLDKPTARIQVLETEVGNLENEKADLVKQLNNNKDAIDVLKNEANEVKKSLENIQSESKEQIETKDKDIADLKQKLEDAEKELASLKAEKLGALRITELETAGIKFGERRDNIIKKISIMSDEDFASYRDDLLDIAGVSSQDGDEDEDEKDDAAKQCDDEKAQDKNMDEKKKKDDEEDEEEEMDKDKKENYSKSKSNESDSASDEDDEDGSDDEDGALPNLEMSNDIAAAFNFATSSSAQDMDIDESVLENAFKQVTTRDKEHARGNNQAF